MSEFIKLPHYVFIKSIKFEIKTLRMNELPSKKENPSRIFDLKMKDLNKNYLSDIVFLIAKYNQLSNDNNN